VVPVDFREGIDHAIIRPQVDAVDLRQEILGPTLDYPTKQPDGERALLGRILIIEDLSKEAVEILGGELDIDPLFFSLHLDSAQRRGMRRQTPIDATLPSRFRNEDYINVFYHRSVTSDVTDPPRRRLWRDTVVDRKLMFLRSTDIGLAQHCTSVIQIKNRPSFWIGKFNPNISTYCN
jgi:hypothetical protein